MTTTPNIWRSAFNVASTTFSGDSLNERISSIVGLANGNFLVAWDDSGNNNDGAPLTDVIGRIYDASGSPLGSTFLLNSTSTGLDERFHSIAATADGGFVTVFRDSASHNPANPVSLKFESYDAQGALAHSGTVATGQVGVSSITQAGVTVLDNGNLFVTFARGDISSTAGRAIILAPDGTTAVSEFDVGTISQSSPFGRPIVAATLENGNAAVVQTDLHGVGLVINYRIMMAIYAPNGSTVLAPVEVTPLGSGNYVEPRVVALEGGGFAVSFSRFYISNNFEETYYSVFSATGAEVKPPTLLETAANADEVVPSIAALADGGFAVASSGGIYRFDAAGTQIGSKIDIVEARLGTASDGRLLAVNALATNNLPEPDANVAAIIFDPRDAGITQTDGFGRNSQITAPVGGGTVNGMDGSDRLFGHDAADTLDGGSGSDVVKGGAGNDTIVDADGLSADTLDGGTGTNLLDHRLRPGVHMTIDLSLGRTFFGGTQIDTIINFANVEGSNGGDTVVETLTVNAINLNGGNDRLVERFGLAEGDSYNGGGGTDTFDLSRNSWATGTVRVDLAANVWRRNGVAETVQQFENIDGGNGTVGEVLLGSTADNTINGNAGPDIVAGGLGRDTLAGGNDNDTLQISQSDIVSGEVLNGGGGTDTLQLTGNGLHIFDIAVLSSIEVVDFFNFGTTSRTARFLAAQFEPPGISAAVVFDGNSQTGVQDIVHINMGTAEKLALNQAAFLDWGDGADSVRVFGDNDAETITGTSVADQITAAGGQDTVKGGAGNDVLTGGEGNDFLLGENDSDTLHGEAGRDTLRGGGGNDTLRGGDEAGLGDTLAGEAGADTIHGGQGGDRIEGGADGDLALNGEAGDDTIIAGDGDDGANGGTENDVIYGEAGRDTLRGGSGADTIYGGNETGAGDILLAGDAGDDHVQGGLGDDRIDGGSEGDDLFGEGGDDVITGGAGGDRLEGGSEADILRGEADNDYLLGGDDGDTLYGGAGIDYLYGNGGDDFLQADTTNDNLYGGLGLDRFNFDPGNGSDAIFDFANDQDTLVIDPGFGFANAAAVVAATIQTGNHARILLPGTDTDIYLWNYLTPGNGNTIGNLADDILIA